MGATIEQHELQPIFRGLIMIAIIDNRASSEDTAEKVASPPSPYRHSIIGTECARHLRKHHVQIRSRSPFFPDTEMMTTTSSYAPPSPQPSISSWPSPRASKPPSWNDAAIRTLWTRGWESLRREPGRGVTRCRRSGGPSTG